MTLVLVPVLVLVTSTTAVHRFNGKAVITTVAVVS